ncbi:hypothetical protein RirG_243370 [Rhizophagus irregularis DAOM 197198w]|uniref:Uncharacterized protein n=1 Tax=Rhizophagus irregularis (strain DAOM 197198w) TaxID=1432141 RepID=A0A015I8I1_RHIIW|nr:hypothetical protein RirG_243370 [Rhizophagus irregularis DAOM 197198w]
MCIYTRSTCNLVCYQSYFVMNICARFQIQDLEYLETVMLPIIIWHEHLRAFSHS